MKKYQADKLLITQKLTMHIGQYPYQTHQQITTAPFIVQRTSINSSSIRMRFPPPPIVACQTPTTTSLPFIKLLKYMKPAINLTSCIQLQCSSKCSGNSFFQKKKKEKKEQLPLRTQLQEIEGENGTSKNLMRHGHGTIHLSFLNIYKNINLMIISQI